MIGSRRGMTVPELLTALCILAVLLGLAVPSGGRIVDGQAVRGGREALAAGIARARAEALVHGGARFVLETEAGRFRIETLEGDRIADPVVLDAEYGVTVVLDGEQTDAVELRFDGLGIGRVASRTIRVRRGKAEAGLTVSAYGRVRRW